MATSDGVVEEKSTKWAEVVMQTSEVQNNSFTDYENVEIFMDIKEPEWLSSSDEDENAVAKQRMSKTLDVTPRKDNNSVASSPQFRTPHPSELILPFSSCNESPIGVCLIAASTPFQGQRNPSTSSINELLIKNRAQGNATFNMDKGKGSSTFVLGANESRIGDGTFVKENNNQTFCKEENLTFDVKSSEKDSGSDIMDSCTHLESSAESADDKGQRKPLRSLPQPKATHNTNTSNRNATKKGSRLAAPRMNTAAISRIQARSPGSVASSTDSSKTIKKPNNIGNATKARKSLLPPSITRSSAVNNRNRKCSTVAEEPTTSNVPTKTTRNVTSGSTPTKRKAQESPKRIGRSPKIPGGRSVVPPRVTTTASTRSNSAPTSKLTSTTARSSRPHRPSGLKGPYAFSRSTSNIGTSKLVGSSGSVLTSTKSISRPLSNNNNKVVSQSEATSSALTDSGNLRKPKLTEQTKSSTKSTPKNTECVTALSILLDYVVNKLDGLSAPRLSEEKQQLQKLVADKVEVNDNLSSRLSDLESRFKLATAEYEQNCREQIERYEQQLFDEKSAREQIVTQLSSELDKERQSCREQITVLRIEQEELKHNYETELSNIQDEWSSKYQKLQDDMENTIKEELKERIKPYINAKSEVDSLTTVLEMKNHTIHQLEAECSKYSTQTDQVNSLNYKIDQLRQKNEDLSMQLHEKMDETRNMSMEKQKLQQSMSEEQTRLTRLRQHNEELQYRLDSLSPSPSPSFNPVFTTSPTVVDPPNAFGSTPRNPGFKRAANGNGNSLSYDDKLCRSLSYNYADEGNAVNNSL
ncbi:uncharacterized protein LOC120329426 isoform X1 [Styela clava]